MMSAPPPSLAPLQRRAKSFADTATPAARTGERTGVRTMGVAAMLVMNMMVMDMITMTMVIVVMVMTVMIMAVIMVMRSHRHRGHRLGCLQRADESAALGPDQPGAEG